MYVCKNFEMEYRVVGGVRYYMEMLYTNKKKFIVHKVNGTWRGWSGMEDMAIIWNKNN